MIPGLKFAPNLIITFILLVAASPAPAPGQERPPADTTRSIADEILAHPESDVTLLGKSRAVLLEAIQEGDTAKARKVVAYMEERFDSSTTVILFSGEGLLIAYWLGEHERVCAFGAANEEGQDPTEKKLYPLRDRLFSRLQEISRTAHARLTEGIATSGLPPYKKDFLALLLSAVLGPEKDTEEGAKAHRESLNAESNEYLLSYRDSEFIPFIRQNIRYVIATSRWGLGYELAIGYLGLPTALAAHMPDYFLVTLACDLTYDQWYSGLRLDIGAAHHLRKGFEYNGTWRDDLLVMQFAGVLGLGRMIPMGNNFTVTPMLGIGFSELSPPPQEAEKEGNDVSLSFATWAIGANVDVPLGGDLGSPYLRLHVGHRSAITGIPLAKGGYTFITLGLSWFGRPTYREE